MPNCDNELRSLTISPRRWFARRTLLLFVLWTLAFDLAGGRTAGATEESHAFTQVAQLLEQRCGECHRGESAEGGYDLSTVAGIFAKGESDAAPVVSGDAMASELFQRLISDDEELRMPAGGPPLEQDEVGLIRRWIDAGAATTGFGAEVPLVEIAIESTQSVAPERYPRPIPIRAIAAGHSPTATLSDWFQRVALSQLGTPPAQLGTPPGQQLFVAGYGEVLVRGVDDGALLDRWNGFGPFIGSIAVSPDFRFMAVSHGSPGSRGRVSLLQLDRDRSLQVEDLLRTTDIPAEIEFDGTRLAVGCQDGTVYVFDFESREQLYESTLHADAIDAIGWSREEGHLLTASRDRTARVVDVGAERTVSSYAGHERAVRGICALPAGPVTIDLLGTVRLWPQEGRTPILSRDFPTAANVGVLSHAELLFVPTEQGIVRTTVDWKEVETEDDEGKKKKKSVPQWNDWPTLLLGDRRRLTSLFVDHRGGLFAGTMQGEVLIWRDASKQEGDRQPRVISCLPTR